MKKQQQTGRAAFRLEAATADLLRAVTRVASVTERRNTVPILSFVELACGFGTVALRATDLDIEARAEIPAEGDGALALPAARLRDLLRATAHVERVTFTSDEEGVVTMMAGDVVATMFSLPAVDLPNLTLGDKLWSANLAEGVTKFLIGGVVHAISTEETRYYLNGVCLEVADGKLVAVATDGHRLAERETTLAADPGKQKPVIVPRKAATLALSFAGEGEATLVIHSGADGGRAAYAEVTAGGVRLRAKLIDGTYPDWRRVVPAASNRVIAVETKALRRVLKAVRANSEDRTRRMKIEAQAGGVRILSTCPDGGEMRASLPCEVSGAFEAIGVNGRYVDELAASMERVGSKTMRLHVGGVSEPLRIVPDEAITGALSVLMPMRV